jgi:Protein of unknown function (DUF2874).
MKKILVTLAIAFSSIAAFAGEENVSTAVLNAFNREFTGVKNVQWTSSEEFVKASFEFNGQFVNAFYQHNGELIAMTRNISSLELPISLQANLKNQYSGYWISELFEYSTHGGTTYYITLENADSKKVLKSDESGKWETYRKTAKL